MAKGKHAAALFEVIHADRRFGKKGSPAESLSTPKWWFKGKGRSRAASASPAASMPVAATSPEPLDYMPSVPSDGGGRSVDVKVDPDRQQINFRLTYSSAIVGGFTLLVVLSLAYVIGRKMSAGPAAAVAATVSTEEIRKQPAQPGVMDLAKAARDASGVRSIAPDGDESAHVIDPNPANGNVTRAPAPPPLVKTSAAAQPFNGNRIINQNYVVIQSFPESEKALAEEAAKRLNQAGIGATVERGLKGWPPTWYSVVGTMPFERTRDNPVYDAYKQSIMDVSAKYAGKSQYKKFDPIPKKWVEN
jgi:hypothetical protein